MRTFKNLSITVQATVLFVALVSIYLLGVAAALAANKDRPAYFLPEERKIIYEYYHRGSSSRVCHRDWPRKVSCHRAYRSTWTKWEAPARIAETVRASSTGSGSSASAVTRVLGKSHSSGTCRSDRPAHSANIRHHRKCDWASDGKLDISLPGVQLLPFTVQVPNAFVSRRQHDQPLRRQSPLETGGVGATVGGANTDAFPYMRWPIRGCFVGVRARRILSVTFKKVFVVVAGADDYS